MNVLNIENLSVSYRSRQRRGQPLRVINDLSLGIGEGEALGLVGESGSGKSTLGKAIVGLVPVSAGSIWFRETELTSMSRRARRPIKRELQIVFQNPLMALSPRRRIGHQLHEVLKVHTSQDRTARRTRIHDVVSDLELSESMLDRFPHELSGGQAQRVVLARALVLEPAVILFDEPTSALDVSVQAGVLNLLRRLKAERDLTYLFITHDLGVARHLCDRIAVLRRGEIVEVAKTPDLFAVPQHPYTQQLLASSPTLGTHNQETSP